MDNLDLLVNELRKLSNEVPWVEFKHNNYDPHMIGKDISALANSAALHEKNCAYMLWGIDDTTHDITGTNYDLQSLKKGDQEIENWLRSLKIASRSQIQALHWSKLSVLLTICQNPETKK